MVPTLNDRAAGVLLHPTSLATPYGIGDLGPAAFAFADFMTAAGLRWWQTLPIGPVGREFSPYQTYSAFAGNALLISPDLLYRKGWLQRDDLKDARMPDGPRVLTERVITAKNSLLRHAFARFKRDDVAGRKEFDAFRRAQRAWLDDYALFCALRVAQGEDNWTRWEPAMRRREPAALHRAARALEDEVSFFAFQEWAFDGQWRDLRAYAAARGIGMIGDVPIFIAPGGCDVWAHPELFQLRADGRPRAVAGVAPDYFSKTGQRWGNPHYNWAALKRSGYAWWIERFKQNLRSFDAVRLDHFIGFIRYYEVPGDAATAEHGRYRKGPGADFFRAVLAALKTQAHGAAPFIAEDLGTVTPEVKAVRDEFRLPGMKVLQFAFGTDPEARSYRPHNYPHNSVVYTGTHDNDTTVGWFQDRSTASTTRSEADIDRERAFTLRYLNCQGRDIHWAMIRAAFASPSNAAIAPLQDFLGLDSRARMNRPGVADGNWTWRLTPGALTAALAGKIRDLAELYGRI